MSRVRIQRMCSLLFSSLFLVPFNCNRCLCLVAFLDIFGTSASIYRHLLVVCRMMKCAFTTKRIAPKQTGWWNNCMHWCRRFTHLDLDHLLAISFFLPSLLPWTLFDPIRTKMDAHLVLDISFKNQSRLETTSDFFLMPPNSLSFHAELALHWTLIISPKGTIFASALSQDFTITHYCIRKSLTNTTSKNQKGDGGRSRPSSCIEKAQDSFSNEIGAPSFSKGGVIKFHSWFPSNGQIILKRRTNLSILSPFICRSEEEGQKMIIQRERGSGRHPLPHYRG